MTTKITQWIVYGPGDLEYIKMKEIMNKIKKTLITAFLLGFSFYSSAADWPTKDLTVIVPFPAGGTVDKIARSFAQELPQIVNRPVTVKNVPGALNVLGINELGRSDPDHTVIFTLGSVVYSGIASDNNIHKQLQPLLVVGNSKITVFKTPGTRTEEFVDSFKMRRPVLVGSGDTIDNSQMWLDSIAGLTVEYVPFKGAPQHFLSVMQGQPKFGLCSVFCVMSYVENKQVEVAFVSGTQRSRFLPDVPSASELGMKAKNYDYDTVYLAAASKDMNPEVLEKFNQALKKAGLTSEAVQRYNKLGMDVTLTNVQESKRVWDGLEKLAKHYYKKD